MAKSDNLSFIIIRPGDQSVEHIFGSFAKALAEAELDSSAIDHGIVARFADGTALSLVVYEWGLKAPKDSAYFSIGKNLYNGNAVIYQYDSVGETVRIDGPKFFAIWSNYGAWLKDIGEVEAAITAGKILRPESSIIIPGGAKTVFWEFNKI